MKHPIETIGSSEAKTHLSRLLRETESGRVFHITHRGRVVAELRPPAPTTPAAARGDLQGKIKMADDFFAPLDDFRDYSLDPAESPTLPPEWKSVIRRRLDELAGGTTEPRETGDTIEDSLGSLK